jgi:hypothetical protein
MLRRSIGWRNICLGEGNWGRKVAGVASVRVTLAQNLYSKIEPKVRDGGRTEAPLPAICLSFTDYLVDLRSFWA